MATIGMCERCTTVLAELYRFHKEFSGLRPGGGGFEVTATNGYAPARNGEIPTDEYLSSIVQSHLLPESNDYHYSHRLSVPEADACHIDLDTLQASDPEKLQLKMTSCVSLLRLEEMGKSEFSRILTF